MDFRVTLTDEEHSKLGRIAAYHKRVYGVRTKTAIFRAWMSREYKRITLEEKKEGK